VIRAVKWLWSLIARIFRSRPKTAAEEKRDWERMP
jgi:hypothetical protein